MPGFKTFVINLDSSSDRLQSVTRSLDECSIEFERIFAVDARNASPTDFEEYDDANVRKMMGRCMMQGEVGCYLSHCRALKNFLKSDAEYGLILEDDAVLPSDFASAVRDILDWLESNSDVDWELINLGHSTVKFTSNLKQFSNFSLAKAHYAPMVALSLLWTREAAETFLQNNRTISAPFDNTIQNWLTRNGGCLSVIPPLVKVADFDSTLDNTPINCRPTRGNNNRTLTYGLRKQKRLWSNRFWASIHKYLMG